jgi:small-conductance mechanosensitive channel
MTRVQAWTRQLLLGNDASWGATFATGRLGISVLAASALVLHVLDLATGLRMMLAYGIQLELNPLARYVMHTAGPIGLVELKLGVVLVGVLLFVRTAQVGRPRLARNCLLIAVCIGMLGFTSNLVG